MYRAKVIIGYNIRRHNTYCRCYIRRYSTYCKYNIQRHNTYCRCNIQRHNTYRRYNIQRKDDKYNLSSNIYFFILWPVFLLPTLLNYSVFDEKRPVSSTKIVEILLFKLNENLTVEKCFTCWYVPKFATDRTELLRRS